MADRLVHSGYDHPRQAHDMTMLELGGGTAPHPRADIIIDLHHPRAARPQDATVTPWTQDATQTPWWGGGDTMLANASVDEVYASHFMEHIPKGQPLLDVMNEAWRILRPGGTFTMILPIVGYTDHGATGEPMSNQIGWQPWADPTHVSHWWFPESLWYFTETNFRPNAEYGMSAWESGCRRIDESLATQAIDAARRLPVQETMEYAFGSFWSVRSGWEGIARIVKPS